MTYLLLYLGIGAGLAAAALAVPKLRRLIDRLAGRMGMDIRYARLVWLGGTVLAWPVGLYVLATGRLLLARDRPAFGDAPVGEVGLSGTKAGRSRATPAKALWR